MKRFLGILVSLFLTATPLMVSAASLSASEQYSLPEQKTVVGNLYVAAGTTTIGGRVSGDVFTAGGTITVSGSIGGDLVAGGGTVQVLGPVNGDVRIIGGTTTINSRVGGDLVVVGGTTHILPGASISGDVLVAGGQVIIDGAVYGNVKYAGGALHINGSVRGSVSAKMNDRLEIGSTASINGKLTYSAPREAVIAQGAHIAGAVRFDPVAGGRADRGVPQRAIWAIIGLVTGMKLLAVLGLTLIITWRWRRQATEVLAVVRTHFWQSLGHGIAYMILVPIAAILLLMSFVGILPGVLVILSFITALILTKALTGIFVGALLMMMFNKKDTLHITWGSAIGGVFLLEIITLIPVVGWLVGTAVWLGVFGAVGQRIQSHLSRS